jgi:hypothetical protein
MRIVQHKTAHATPGKDPVEMVGLSNPPPNVQSEVAALSTSPNTKSHSIEASQVAHHKIEKPQVHAKPTMHIQQPRKQ